jgi:hypothetical protein
MIKRESFYVTVKRIPNTKWTPAPRECATLTFVNYSAFLLGGLNYDVSKDIAQLNLTRMGDSDYEQEQNQPKWKNVEYTTNDLNLGRCRHTSVTYDDKIFSFGGCFMFNKKRMIRECSKEMTIYNVALNSYQITRTKGVQVLARKDHHAAIFGKSMIIYGGQFENGQYSNELLNFDLEYYDWSYLNFKQNVEPFSNGACASVASVKSKGLTRLVSITLYL